MESSTSEPQNDLYLSRGLSGQDERFDYLLGLFEQLQLATVETCNPALDIMTFAEVAYYFAVIMKKNPRHEEKTKDSTSSDNQVGLSGGNMPNRQGESSKTFGPWHRHRWYDVGHPKPQVMEQEPMGMSSQSPDSFIEGADSTQQTSQNFWSNLHHDLPLEGPSVSDYEMGGHFADNSTSQDDAIGLVYLVNLAGPTGDYLRDRELNIGIILNPVHRGKGYAHRAIEMVLKVAFETEKCHRVQAILPDHVAKDRAICFFTQMRFNHEGTRRRAFYSQMEGVYKDVTYMGILDTDWMVHHTGRQLNQKFGCPAPKSVWDELLSRHQREREELLNWEAGIRSSGALKKRARTPTQSCFKASEGNDDDDDDDDEMGFENTLDAVSMRKPKDGKIELKTVPKGRENDPFVTSTDSECSDSPDGYFSASSSGSAWDVVESSDLDHLPSSSSYTEDEMPFDFEFIRGNSM